MTMSKADAPKVVVLVVLILAAMGFAVHTWVSRKSESPVPSQPRASVPAPVTSEKPAAEPTGTAEGPKAILAEPESGGPGGTAVPAARSAPDPFAPLPGTSAAPLHSPGYLPPSPATATVRPVSPETAHKPTPRGGSNSLWLAGVVGGDNGPYSYTAVLRFDGRRVFAQRGDLIPGGYYLKSVNNNGVILAKGRARVRILVGQEKPWPPA